MRSQAREQAFKLIYERLFVKKNYNVDEEFFSVLEKEDDKLFANEILNQFILNQSHLGNLISSSHIDYELERVYKIDLALIYLALTEIFYLNTPKQVAISEALLLAEKYSTDKSKKFINGVLSSILKKENI